MANQFCAEKVIRGILNILCISIVGPRRFIFTMTKVNTNNFSVALKYTTSQRFDFAVRSVATGREVWRWSVNRVFTPVVQEIILKPGETTSQSVEWPAVDNFGNPVPAGRYVLRGENLAIVRRIGVMEEDILYGASAFSASKMPVIEINFEHALGASSKAKVVSSSVKPLAGNLHTVQSGDSLWKIAQQYGTTINKLKVLNKLANPDKLQIGQKIKIK